MTTIGENDSILAGVRRPKGGVRRGPDHSQEAESVFFLVIHTHVVMTHPTPSDLGLHDLSLLIELRVA